MICSYKLKCINRQCININILIMKNQFLLPLLLIISVSAFGQPRVHLGLTTAMNSTYVLDKGLKSDSRYEAHANYEWAPIGFSLGLDISRKFGFQLESIKAAQGQIYQIVDAYDQVVGERKIYLDYFQFPLLMRFLNGSDKAVRFNFQFGPQLSILNYGEETMEYLASTQEIPEGTEIPEGATLLDAEKNLYDVPAMPTQTLLSSAAEEEINKFKNKELQLAFGFGFDIDILRNFYLRANVRGNYSFMDMRNQDLIDMIDKDDLTSIFDNRSNLLVGVQLGFHWMIGGTRSFGKKDKQKEELIDKDDPFKGF